MLRSTYEQLQQLLQRYELHTEDVVKDIERMDHFKVTTPIIGGFSTGKTSMINAFLQENLLRTNITAETAVPTEISYGAVRVRAVKGEQEMLLTLEDLKEREFSVADTDYLSVQLQNAQLQQLSTLEVVDMPGFDSGIQAHNTAIDQYLHKSLAYILTFAADEPVVKESVADFLRELKLFDVPVYVCVTKADKVTADVLVQNMAALEGSIQQLLGVAPKKIVAIWSKRNRNTDGLRDILFDLEASSRAIFTTTFTRQLVQHAKKAEQYLEERLKGAMLSVSDIDEKAERIEQEMVLVQSKIEREQQRFSGQLAAGITAIESRISEALDQNREALSTQLMRGGDLQAKLNMIIRTAITAGLREEFEPKLQQHVQNLANVIQLDMPIDSTIQFDQFKVQSDQMVKDLAVKSLPLILGAIGVVLTGPIGGIIVGVVTLLADILFQKKRQHDLRQEAEQKVSSEIIPAVLQQAGLIVEQELTNCTATVHAAIQEEVGKQRDLLQKALEDLRVQKMQQQAEQERLQQQLTADLQQVKEILHDTVYAS